MPNSKSIIIRRGAIALIAALAAAAIGYGTGHTTKRIPDPTAKRWDNSRSTEATEHPNAVGKISASDRAKHLEKLKLRLIQRWRASPESNKDFELMDETHRQLSTLSARELADFYHSLTSQFSLDSSLQQTVLREWALKDGPASVTQSKPDRWSPDAIHAFQTWGYQDPQKALAWLRETELPLFLKDQKFTIRINFLIDLAKTDFGQVVEELSHLDAKERAAIVRNLGGAIESHPEFLEKIRELTKNDSDPASLLAMERVRISQQAKTGPAAALEYIAGLNLSPADKAELELDLFRQDFDHPEKSFGDWLARNPDIEAVPDSLWPMMDIRYTMPSGGNDPLAGFAFPWSLARCLLRTRHAPRRLSEQIRQGRDLCRRYFRPRETAGRHAHAADDVDRDPGRQRARLAGSPAGSGSQGPRQITGRFR